jgi:hypothetical protein
MTGQRLAGESRLVVGGGLSDFRLFNSGLDGSNGLLLTEIVLSGVQEASELQCRLLPGDLDIISVSVTLLVMRLLLSSL